MEYYIDNSRYVAAHVDKIEQMKKKPFSDIKPYIRPYLQFKDSYKMSWEEFKEEWGEVHTVAEMKQIYEELYPDLPYKEWLGFKIFFIIDWMEADIDIAAWDYITTDVMHQWKTNVLELYEIALNNMEGCKRRNIVQCISDEDTNTNLKMYRAKYITKSFPYGSVIILSEKLRDKMQEHIGDDYYVFFEGEKSILCIPQNNLMEHDMKMLWKDIVAAVNPKEQLLDYVLLCKHKQISII